MKKILLFLMLTVSAFAQADSVVGNLKVQKAFNLQGTITPPQILADVNNYLPNNFAISTTIRVSSDAERSITGMGTALDGNEKRFWNVGSFNILFQNESTSSTAACRFLLGGLDTVVLKPGGGIVFQYDATAARWRMISSSAAAGNAVATTLTGEVTGNGIGVVPTTITAGAVVEAKIANSAVTTAKIADANVTTAKIADLNVTTGKIADSAITTAKLTDVNVTTGKIADSAITTGKVANSAVSNAKLADMASKTYKGRTSAGTGVPEDVTASQLRADLSIDTTIGTSTQSAVNGYFSDPSTNGSFSASAWKSDLQLNPTTDAEFVNATTVEPWGDSLTYGAGSSGGLTYPAQLAAKLGYTINNNGVGGETSTQIKTRFIAASSKYGRMAIFWLGRNNYTNPTQVKADIAECVAALGHDRYLVLSILNGEFGTNEYVGGAGYATMMQLNADLAALYGPRYVDVRSYLVSKYNSGNAQDVIDYGHDIVPSSLRTDSIHLTNEGYGHVADLVATYVTALRGTFPSVSTQSTIANWFTKPIGIGGIQPNFGKFTTVSGTTGTFTTNVVSPYFVSGSRTWTTTGDGSMWQSNSGIAPGTTASYDMGFSFLRWRNIYAGSVDLTGNLNMTTGDISARVGSFAGSASTGPLNIRSSGSQQAGGGIQYAQSVTAGSAIKWRNGLHDMVTGSEGNDLLFGYYNGSTYANSVRFGSNGNLTIAGSYVSAAPPSGTATPWTFGTVTSNTARVGINGTGYDIPTLTSGLLPVSLGGTNASTLSRVSSTSINGSKTFGVSDTDISIVNGAKLAAALGRSRLERVAVVGLGDSNQAFGGAGWAYYIAKELYNFYGSFGTGLMPMGVQYAGNYAAYLSGAGRNNQGASTGAPTQLDNYAKSGIMAQYAYVPDGSTVTGQGYSQYSGTVDALHPLNISGNLKFRLSYGTFTTGTGMTITPKVRREASPFDYYSPTASSFNPVTGSYGIVDYSMTLAAGNRPNNISFNIVNPNTSITGPFIGYYMSVENNDKTTGLSYQSLVIHSGGSLKTFNDDITTGGTTALNEWFRQVKLQLTGSNPSVVVMINSGANDRNEASASVGPNPQTPGDSAAAYADNLQGIVNKLTTAWTANGGNAENIHFCFMPTHPISQPDDSELAAYRSAAMMLASTLPNCSAVLINNMADYLAFKQGDWYDNGGNIHLKAAGYQNVATRLSNYLARYDTSVTTSAPPSGTAGSWTFGTVSNNTARVGVNGTGYDIPILQDTMALADTQTASMKQIIGPAAPISASNFTAGYTLTLSQPVARSGFLNRLEFYTGDAGSVKIKRISKSASGLFYTSGEFTLTAASGANTFTASQINGGVAFPVQAGDLIGYYSASVRLHYTSGASGWTYYELNGDVSSTPSNTMEFRDLSRKLQFRADVVTPNSSNSVTVGAGATTSASSLSTVSLVVPSIYQPNGILRSFSLDVSTLGNGSFILTRNKLRVPDNTDYRIDVLESVTLTASTTGVNTFIAGTNFNIGSLGKNEFYAIQTVTSGAQPRYNTSGGSGYLTYVGTAANTVAMTGAAGEIYTTFTIVPALEASVNPNDNVVLEKWTYTSAAPLGWSAPTWTFSGGAAVAGTANVASAMVSNLYASGDRRTLRWEIDITNASSVIYGYTNPGSQGIAAGTMVKIDSGADEISLMTRTADGTVGSALVGPAALGFDMTTGKKYFFTMSFNGRSVTYGLEEKDGPSRYVSSPRTASPLGYAGPGSTNSGYDQGAGQGYASIAYTSGGLRVYSFVHTADVMSGADGAVGDSITQGFSVTDAQRWAQKMRDGYGDNRKAYIMAFGGAGLGSFFNAGEIAAVKPKNTFIHLGTNGSPTQANYLAHLGYMKLLGTNPIYFGIPTDATKNGYVMALPSDVVKLNIAATMTATGAGSTRQAAYYTLQAADTSTATDNVHPNDVGNTEMNRVRERDTMLNK